MKNIKMLDCGTCVKKDVCKIYDDIISMPSTIQNSYLESYDLKNPQNKVKDSLNKVGIINKHKCLDVLITCDQYEGTNTHISKNNLLDG